MVDKATAKMSLLDYFSSMCRFLLRLVGSIFVVVGFVVVVVGFVVGFVVALAPFSPALIAGSVLWFQYGYIKSRSSTEGWR